MGYTHNGSGWVSVKNGSGIWFNQGDGTASLTYNKDNSALRSAGWIDSTGNLAAAHDAATAHLGAPWRMPTRGDIDALIGNCTTTSITTNGVKGLLVTGKDDYAGRSIFLPAADSGYNNEFGADDYYWSSTPHLDDYGMKILSARVVWSSGLVPLTGTQIPAATDIRFVLFEAFPEPSARPASSHTIPPCSSSKAWTTGTSFPPSSRTAFPRPRG